MKKIKKKKKKEKEERKRKRGRERACRCELEFVNFSRCRWTSVCFGAAFLHFCIFAFSHAFTPPRHWSTFAHW